ncbi:MAG: hypothetical protein AAFY71_03500 [Bacteroidota bacterium]
MRDYLLPIAFSIMGYLLCFSVLFVPWYTSLEVIWSIGILLHVLGSLFFFRTEEPLARKWMYLLIPVPLGFFITLMCFLSFIQFTNLF